MSVVVAAPAGSLVTAALNTPTVFRWLIVVILACSIGLSGYFRRRARAATGTIARREEGGALVALRLAVTLPLLASILAYLINPSWMSWSAIALPEWVRWGGATVGVLVVPFLYWVLGSIGANISETVLVKEKHELVTVGPYRWIRHPLYTSGLLLLTAVGLMAANAVLLSYPILAYFVIRHIVIPREEAALTLKFGDEYLKLIARTGRLAPRFIIGRAE